MPQRPRARSRAPVRRKPRPSARTKPQPSAPKQRGGPPRQGTPRPVPAHRTYTPELIEIVRRRYEETAETVVTIGADLGIHPSSVHRMAKSRGWARRNLLPPRGVSPALRLAEAARALAEGGVAASTAADVGLADAAGMPPPERGRPTSQRVRPNWAGPMTGSARRVGVVPETAMTPTRQPSAADLPLSGGGIAAAPPNDPTPAEPSTLDRLERAVVAELATVEAMRASLGSVPQRWVDAQGTARTLNLLTQTMQHLQRLRAAQAGTPQPDLGSNHDDDDWPADIDEFRFELARRIEAFVASRADDGDADQAAGAVAKA